MLATHLQEAFSLQPFGSLNLRNHYFAHSYFFHFCTSNSQAVCSCGFVFEDIFSYMASIFLQSSSVFTFFRDVMETLYINQLPNSVAAAFKCNIFHSLALILFDFVFFHNKQEQIFNNQNVLHLVLLNGVICVNQFYHSTQTLFFHFNSQEIAFS